MSYPYRCSKPGCRKRIALKQKIEQYVDGKNCPACGKDSLKLDTNKRREGRRMRCSCDGYHFPHRKGSLWCIHSTIVPTDDDHRNRDVRR